MTTHAMILAAGHGTRLAPLTWTQPKALIRVADKPLIVHVIEQICRAGIKHIVINLGHRGHLIRQLLGDGQFFNVSIAYSYEPPDGLYLAGGGIKAALKHLGSSPFVLASADIWSNIDIGQLKLHQPYDAQLVVINHAREKKDFSMNQNLIGVQENLQWTFAGVALCRPSLFASLTHRATLMDALLPAINNQRVSGWSHRGKWVNVGDLKRLDLARQLAASQIDIKKDNNAD